MKDHNSKMNSNIKMKIKDIEERLREADWKKKKTLEITMFEEKEAYTIESRERRIPKKYPIREKKKRTERKRGESEILRWTQRLFSFFMKKLAGAVLTIFLVMSFLFFLIAANQREGGDMVTRVAPFASSEEKTQLRELWGLDRPMFVQYLVFIKKAFTLDYRLTYGEKSTSLDRLLMLLPYTLLLFGTATAFTYILGMLLGIRLLSGRSNFLKTLITAISVVFYAIPAFVFALYFRNWFIFKYHIFPPVNININSYLSFDASEIPPNLSNIESIIGSLPSMFLPFLVLVIVGLARPLLLLKDHMTLLLDEPYVQTARAKGLSENAILKKHVARCALLPLLNDASINLALIFSGGVLIEYIFSWPGIGSQLFIALKNLYYPTIAASIFILTVLLLLFMIIADILSFYLDPRVSTS